METVGGIPVECLTSGELNGVWSGWSSMGDREVVRESSVKGIHIKLAYKFLSHRRQWSIDEAKKYFHCEVEIWINELLQKCQVHRASHILKNVGQDPIVYIRQICIQSTDVQLINYLANHISNHKGFTPEQHEAWRIFHIFNEYKRKINSTDDYSYQNISIETILNLDESIKKTFLTELYFNTFDNCLIKHIDHLTLWDYLLSNNHCQILMHWIDKYYNNSNSIITIKDNEITELFYRLQMIPEMFENIETSRASVPIKETVLNHLSKYGIFCQKEQQDVKLMLTRMLNELILPLDFKNVLSKNTSTLNVDIFLLKLHSILYYKNANELDYNKELYLKDKTLLNILEAINGKSDVASDKRFTFAVTETINYLSNSPTEYLENNLFILLSLIILKFDNEMSKLSFNEFIENEDNLIFNNIKIKKYVQVLLNNFYYLKKALKPNLVNESITMYQLLHGYKNLDSNELFQWRINNKQIPNFSNEDLIKKYGHQDKLNYEYYLKETRPCMAAYILVNQPNKIKNNLSSKLKSKKSFNSHIFGLKNINKTEIISTCITFIEFLGVSSEFLRFHITAANYIQSKLNIPTNDLLKSVTYQNLNDLELVMTHLERSFHQEYTNTSINDITEFVSALKSWDFIVRFSVLHDTALPSAFLKYLASNNRWLEFVIVGHVFGYPLEQILKNVRHFKDYNIREHLLISLSNFHLLSQILSTSSSNDAQKIKLKEINAELNSNLIVNDLVEPAINNHQYFPLNQRDQIFNYNLWLTILKCHQSPDPPGAFIKASKECESPILIILAGCYEPSSIAFYFYSWLVISVGNKELIDDYNDCLDHQIWTVKNISDLFKRIISLGYVDTLSRGFEIYMPDNPLDKFFKFLNKFIKYGEFDLSNNYLIEFMDSIESFNSYKIIDWTDTDLTYLNNKYWITIIALESCLQSLGSCLQSSYLQIKFLSIFIENNINLTPDDGPNFAMLKEIILCLTLTNVNFDFNIIKVIDEYNLSIIKEVERCIQQLMNYENFTSALELSIKLNLSCSKIILNQYRCEFKHRVDKNERIDVSFWQKCASDVNKYNVDFDESVGFFIEHAKKVNSYKEQYEILKLAFKTIIKSSSTDRHTIDTLEMTMWKCCILAGPQAIQIKNDKKLFDKLKTELLFGISNLRVSCVLNNDNEKKAVEALINRFIEIEDIETALRINAIFNYKHNDLKILMLCLSLAEGEISPYKLNFKQKSLLSQSDASNDSINQQQNKYSTLQVKTLQPSFSSTLSLNKHLNLSIDSDNSIVLNDDDNDDDERNVLNNIINNSQQIQIDCLSLLEKLVKNLRYGINIGNKIILLYKLSISLKKSYCTLLKSRNPLEILYQVTGISNNSNKIELIGDIIRAYEMNNDKVCKFLTGEIILNITRKVEDEFNHEITNNIKSNSNILMWGNPLAVNFKLVFDLCNDPSSLGWELLKNVNLRLSYTQNGKRNIPILKIVTELIILSHDYFTNACNMEGIASVLRKSQILVNILQQLKLWNLLVHLVTGIGRFTEMNYVFQILKENDQFEFLLSKGMDKIPGLKLALLEFCKKQTPNDKDLFNLIALHFQLYYEIALMWENEAKLIIKQLIIDARKENMKLSNNYHLSTASINSTSSTTSATSVISFKTMIKLIKNEKNEKQLNLIMNNFIHATEYYLQDNKFNLANRCSRQAQLAALQISFFHSVGFNQEFICLFNLTTEEINKIICQTLTFPQCSIFIEAYNYNPEWSSVIYHRVIIHNEIQYLKDFLICKRLTNAIAQDCVCRYRMEKNISKQMTINMQKLINELNDVECKYVLASQLGFKEIIANMLSDPYIGGYLKDTVWKRGFNPQEFIVEGIRAFQNT